MFFFVCGATLFYLQRSSFLFAAFLFFIFAAVPFFVCSVSFLFAAFLFCLQLSFFVCSVSLLFAAFLFCLQRFFFICSVSFLFAAFLLCLQRVPCGPPYEAPLTLIINMCRSNICSVIMYVLVIILVLFCAYSMACFAS